MKVFVSMYHTLSVFLAFKSLVRNNVLIICTLMLRDKVFNCFLDCDALSKFLLGNIILTFSTEGLLRVFYY